MSTRDTAHRRGDYRHFHSIATRWMDNDAYGHVNNVVYYSYFDTVVNEYLIRAGVLDVERSDVIGLVVETQCRYFSELSFPQTGARRACAWPALARRACATKSESLPTMPTPRARRATSCTSTSIETRAGPRPCPRLLRTALERIHA